MNKNETVGPRIPGRSLLRLTTIPHLPQSKWPAQEWDIHMITWQSGGPKKDGSCPTPKDWSSARELDRGIIDNLPLRLIWLFGHIGVQPMDGTRIGVRKGMDGRSCQLTLSHLSWESRTYQLSTVSTIVRLDSRRLAMRLIGREMTDWYWSWKSKIKMGWLYLPSISHSPLLGPIGDWLNSDYILSTRLTKMILQYRITSCTSTPPCWAWSWEPNQPILILWVSSPLKSLRLVMGGSSGFILRMSPPSAVE